MFMHSEMSEISALQRVAEFSVQLRGHQLGEWGSYEGYCQATCIRCSRSVRVYRSLVDPDMDGPALDAPCTTGEMERAA